MASRRGRRGLAVGTGTTPAHRRAAEFYARTWAQSFLEYGISHPAVTAVRAETSKASHMLDYITGGQIL